FPGLVAAARSALLVGPMTTAQLRSAITRPAELVGLAVEGGLVEVLLHDLGANLDDATGYEAGHGAGSLPLLSHAPLATWQRHRGRVLTVADYQATGGIRGGLAATAEKVYADLDEPGRRALRRVMLSLVNVAEETGVTRRRVERADLGDGEQTTR